MLIIFIIQANEASALFLLLLSIRYYLLLFFLKLSLLLSKVTDDRLARPFNETCITKSLILQASEPLIVRLLHSVVVLFLFDSPRCSGFLPCDELLVELLKRLL